jgi:hypothetical protein
MAGRTSIGYVRSTNPEKFKTITETKAEGMSEMEIGILDTEGSCPTNGPFPMQRTRSESA